MDPAPRTTSVPANPADVARAIGQSPTRPAACAPLAVVDAPPAPAEKVMALAGNRPEDQNDVVDDVEDILDAFGPVGPGEPDPGISIQVQHQSIESQRLLMQQVLSWPTAFVQLPNPTAHDALVVVKFRHRRQLRVYFRAVAVASRGQRGWSLDVTR